MGFMRDSKAASIAHMAQQEWDNGGGFFTPVMTFPSTQVVVSAGIEDWAGMLMGITGVGWTLHTWAVCLDPKGRPQAVPLFIRP